MARRFITTVEQSSKSGTDEFEGFTVMETPTYASADDVPRSVRVLIAQAALLRGLPAEYLATLYDLPITWIERFIAEASPDDLACRPEAHGTKFGGTIQ